MTAITSGTATTESGRLVGLRSNTMPLVTVVLALVALTAGWSALARIGFLLTWNDTLSGSGEFTVVACQAEDVPGPDRWRCEGRLTTAAGNREAVLVVGKGAVMSSRPYVGQRVDVFYADGPTEADTEAGLVYSKGAQLAELTRLYLALLPWLMVVIGAAGWMFGLLLERLGTRSTDPDSWWRSSPLFTDLQRRGAIWLVVGVGTFVLYQLVARYLLGSAGVA